VSARAPWIAAAAIAVVLAIAARVGAQADPGRRVAQDVARGQRRFEQLEYRDAIRILAPIPHDPAATRAQKLHALELMAVSHLILGDSDQARQAFEDLLAIDPGHVLRFDDGSPKIIGFFDDVKRGTTVGLDAAVQLEHSAPERPTAGRRIEIGARVLAGADLVKDVVLRWRRRGASAYAESPMASPRRDRWRVAISAPPSSTGYVLDYYIEVRGVAREIIGSVGGAEIPLGMSVRAGRAPTWYRRWYVIAGGAAAITLGAALVITAGDDAPRGTLDPGRVTLTP
jgi:hypothetical protein